MTVVEDAFRAMVDQFKDPLAFLRELIQNALDAGSTTIDVLVTSAPQKNGSHLVTLEVQDTGDGMDREIIETKLTRLFASSKDGDATKIGKFGVGFSSTFSIRPEAVVVDTARGNERWRVVFSPDGTWKLYTLDEAVEGTRVRVLKRVAKEEEARQLVVDAKRTVAKWCRYADAQINYNGATIAEPFTVASPVVVSVPGNAPGDVLVVGLALPAVPPGTPLAGHWGYYNKGLTLLEGHGSFEGAPPWVSFRVRDGALEHTITRDNVIRDDAFARVMRAIHEAAHGPLLDAALVALESGTLSEAEQSAVKAALVLPLRMGLLDKTATRAKRKIFRDARGLGRSLADVRAAVKAKTIARVDKAGPLAEALERAGHVVVRAPAHSGDASLLDAADAPMPLAHEAYIAIVAAAEREQWDAAPLVASVKALLAKTPPLAGVGDVMVARIDDHTGVLSELAALVVDDVAVPVLRASATTWDVKRTEQNAQRDKKRKAAKSKSKSSSSSSSTASDSGGPILVLNLGCPAVAKALELATHDVWLAAFLALRLALPPVPIADGKAAQAAWEARSA